MRTGGMDQLRAALKALSNNGETGVTLEKLAESLNMADEKGRQKLSRRLYILQKQGEATRTKAGEFSFAAESAQNYRGESCARAWKIIRIQTPGWSKQTIASRSRVNRSTIDRYAIWLESEGFIERHGREGNTTLWRTTAKGFDHRGTPWPPSGTPSPYEAENAAMGRLCTLMFTANLDQFQTRAKIRKCLAVLTARFGTQDENTENSNLNNPELQGETNHAE